MRKTKIVCTLGPATDNLELLTSLALNGMDIARFNFSHSDHATHKKRLQWIRSIREQHHLPLAALLDTKGPEVRIGTFRNQKVSLKRGQSFTFSTVPVEGDETQVFVNFEHLAKDVKPGDRILVDDGLVEMKVSSTTDTTILCEVENDGVLSNTKGVNVPGVDLSMPYISSKDRSDIVFGIQQDFDYIAASFTRCAKDIEEVRQILTENNCHTMEIIAKIENLQGVENIDEIIEAADGIMIARGDMGVEIPCEDVPVIQKMIIKKVYNRGKKVITATQMLDSMMQHPRPTRAEITDVANAIYDGTSAIMLSGETAAGKYPLESVQTMVRIAERTEADIDYKKRFRQRDITEQPDITEAISHATCTTANDLNAACIITVTKSGKTARDISKYRPDCMIMGCTTSPHVFRQLNLSWGIVPFLIEEESETFELFDNAVSKVAEHGLIHRNDVVVITAGVPLGVSGNTNLIKVQVVD